MDRVELRFELEIKEKKRLYRRWDMGGEGRYVLTQGSEVFVTLVGGIPVLLSIHLHLHFCIFLVY